MKRTRALMLAAIAIVITWGAVAWRTLPGQLLTRKAHRVAHILTDKPRLGVDCPWDWVSDREVFVARQDEAAILAAPSGPYGPIRPVCIDVTTGSERQLDPLRARINATLAASPGLKLDGPMLSGDGKWALWDTPPYSKPTALVAMSLDGKQARTWPKPPREDYQNGLVWASDSHGFVRLRYARSGAGLEEAEEYRLDSPRATRTRHLAASPRIGGSVVGLLADGGVLVANSWANTQGLVHCAEAYLPGDNRAPRWFTLAPPPRCEVGSLALSADGSRLAWIVYSRQTDYSRPSWWNSIRRWFASTRPRSAIELWTSRPDGTGRKCLGSEPLASSGGPRTGACRWSPSGKTLAFAYGGTLYTIPAD